MDIQEEIAKALDEAFDAWDGEESEPQFVAVRLMPLVRRAQAEALREAHADVRAYTDSGAPFGHRPVEDFLLQRADRIEKEGAGA